MRERLLWIFLIIPLILSLLSVNTMEANAAEIHDVAVTSVTPSPTSAKLGELVNITVFVENQGDFMETFSVTTYYDATTIETETVSNLATGANTSLTFTWDTTGIPFPSSGNFKINATATTVPGETDTVDNTLVSPSRVRVYKSPYIAVVPHSTVNPNLTIGTNYTVSIKTDYNGSDIAGYQFNLTYNPRVLHVVKITNGDLIPVGYAENRSPSDFDPGYENTAEGKFSPGGFDNEAGKLNLTVGYFIRDYMPMPVVSGPGTLANVTFTVVGIGDSYITLGTVVGASTSLFGYTDVKWDWDELGNELYGGWGTDYKIIDAWTPDRGHILHAYFRNSLAEVTHNVAVISVASNTTEVEEGDLVNVTVFVENQGTTAETFNVEVYYCLQAGGEPWPIGTKTVSNLATGANTSLTFTWNTTGAPGVPANYIITAKAEPVSGETDTDNNTLQGKEMVTVKAKPEQPIPLELIIGIGVAVVAIIVIITFALRRGRKPIPE